MSAAVIKVGYVMATTARKSRCGARWDSSGVPYSVMRNINNRRTANSFSWTNIATHRWLSHPIRSIYWGKK
jgi:hypothetical protein